MKKSYILLLLIAFAIVLAGVYAYKNREVFEKPPLKMNSVFDNLSRVVSDSQDNLYLIDKSMKRILKVDSSGTLKKIIRADNRKDGSLFIFADLVADPNGFLYVLNTVLDPSGYYVESEEINRYTPEGIFDSLLYQVEYAKENRPIRPGLLRSLEIRNNYLYFYSIESSRGIAMLNRLSLDGKETKNIYTASLPYDIYLTDITGLALDSVFFTTKQGNIYKVNATGEPIMVYSGDSREKSLPVFLDSDLQKQVYFTDVGRREVNRLNPGGSPLIKTILSNKSLAEQGYDIPFTTIQSISAKQEGSLIVAVSYNIDSPADKNFELLSLLNSIGSDQLNEGDYLRKTICQVISVRPDGKVNFVMNKADYPLKFLIYRWSVWFQVLFIPLLLLYACRIIYVDVLQRKVILALKQGVFIPIIIFSMVIVSLIVYNNYHYRYVHEVFNKLKLIAYLGSQMIDGNRLENITKPEHFMGDDYRAIKATIGSISKENSPVRDGGFYVMAYKLEEGKLYFCINDDDSDTPYYPFDIKNTAYYKVITDGRIITGGESDAAGSWMYAVGPVKNSSGKIVGAFEAGMEWDGFINDEIKLFLDTGKGILFLTIATVVVFIFLTLLLLKSIHILRKGVNEVASGNWNTVVSVNSRDEVADLCDGFNRMSEYIRKYISEITILGESYFRFVPQRFVRFLGKESIAEVQLGDQIKQEMSVLVTSIRSFNVISEELTPEENFDLINSYLKRIGPIIRKYGGFIEKYLGPGIIALFPGEPGDALKAAVEIRRELEIYNGHRRNSGYEPLDIGIGINNGPLMLGIIGEEQRMQGAVVADAVDLAAAIEKSTQKYGASILITEKMLIGLPEQCQYRFLGYVRVDGREEPVNIYDLFEGDMEILRKIKLETKDLFEEGIMLYQDGRFYDARSRFVEVIKLNHRDEAAKLYFFLCDEYFKKGAPKDWSGTLIA